MNFIEISSEAVDRIYAAKYKPVEGSSEQGNEGSRLLTALNPLTSTATTNFPRMTVCTFNIHGFVHRR
jgi:hypothetical protein